ncbi:hypothetical protein H6F86_30740 [Phormidium sp. FACHB-592]|uniref:Uncharacterized protein n=1 Tax=Stenomitos frigidus AS-A4 TaxID=2933935 RepID=A0ABV0KGK5_9CYAN|nr:MULTISPECIES: hypothetical protein [Cyanophyceae]MBD2035835.1 hypothetical protein [Leptolyngbya sp. FACHB-321]MBD2078191.1 hypothetical protein [Phormidium sp. FACHB-592]
MYPSVASEQLIHRFKFWADGMIQTGMSHGHHLYRQIASFSMLQRQQAYSLGIDLVQQGQTVMLTHAEDSYTVWVALIDSAGESRLSCFADKGREASTGAYRDRSSSNQYMNCLQKESHEPLVPETP